MRQDFLNMIQAEETKQITRLGKNVMLQKIAEDDEGGNEGFTPLDDVPAEEKAVSAPQNGAKRISYTGLGKAVGRKVSAGVRHSIASIGSRISMAEKNSPMIRQLMAVDREVVALLAKDVFPRWKKKAEEVDRFLRNEPCEKVAV